MQEFCGCLIHAGGAARCSLVLIAVLALFSGSAFAQKTDIITFKNGDRLTVDIKELTRGKLRVKTTGLETIYIEWRVIESVETSKTYQVELTSGVLLLGTIGPAEAGESISVQTAMGTYDIDLVDVVAIQRIKREQPIWSRIDGSVQFGLNYASGSEIGQTNFGLNASFQESKFILSTDLSGTVTTGSATNDTERYHWGVNYYRIRENRWFWAVNSDLDSNDELGIYLRSLAGAGVGRFLIKSNSSRWSASAGLAASRELRIEDEDQTQFEGQLITNYSLFFFAPKKTDLNLGLVVYPGITESDRLRGNFDSKIRWEIIKDLTWNLTYYYTWDDQPPEGAASEDTGITTSLGYTF